MKLNPRTFATLRKVQTCILSEKLESRTVISHGGVEFVGERAEEESFTSDGDSSTPFAGWFDKVNAFETGGGFGDRFSGVLLVGGIGGEAEI